MYQLFPEHRCLVSAFHCVLPSGDAAPRAHDLILAGVDGKLTSLIMENDHFNVHFLATKCQIPLVSMCYMKDRQMEKKKKCCSKDPTSVTVVVQFKLCLPVTKSSALLWTGAVSNPADRVLSGVEKGSLIALPDKGGHSRVLLQNKQTKKNQNGVPTPPRKCDGGFAAMGQTWGLARSRYEHGLYSLNLNVSLCWQKAI